MGIWFDIDVKYVSKAGHDGTIVDRGRIGGISCFGRMVGRQDVIIEFARGGRLTAETCWGDLWWSRPTSKPAQAQSGLSHPSYIC